MEEKSIMLGAGAGMQTSENTLEERKNTGLESRTKGLKALKIQANDLTLPIILKQIEIRAELSSFKIWLYICPLN